MTYEFRSGKTFRSITADVAGSELETIREQSGGKLRPADVVEAARPKEAPLHPVFTWDSKQAAEAYRLMEARWLIREIVVVYAESELRPPAFINVQIAPEEEGGEAEQYYQSSAVLIENEDEFKAAVHASEGRLISARRSLDELKTLARDNRKQLRLISVAIDHVDAAKTAVSKAQKKAA